MISESTKEFVIEMHLGGYSNEEIHKRANISKGWYGILLMSSIKAQKNHKEH